MDFWSLRGIVLLKIAICDDESSFRSQLHEMIQDILTSKNVTGQIKEYSSGEDMICSREAFDLYFLDIKMDSLTGIETAKKIRLKNKESGIVFITAFREYIFEAFDVQAFHYLIKPVEKEKLRKVLSSFLDKNNFADQFLIAKTKTQSYKINLREILYIESQLRKIRIHTTYETIECYYKFSDVESKVDKYGFFRCHKSYIVNLRYVSKYTGNSITLKNSETIYLSKYRYSEFSKAFMYYLKNGE